MGAVLPLFVDPGRPIVKPHGAGARLRSAARHLPALGSCWNHSMAFGMPSWIMESWWPPLGTMTSLTFGLVFLTSSAKSMDSRTNTFLSSLAWKRKSGHLSLAAYTLGELWRMNRP